MNPRASRAIDALRQPDASLARVPNTIRQSIAEVIEGQAAALDGVFEVASESIRVGAPGLAEVTRHAIARSIATKLASF